MKNDQDPADDLALSGLPEDVATQAELGEAPEEPETVPEETSEEMVSSETSVEEMEKEADTFMLGEEWRSENEDGNGGEPPIVGDEDTEESMLEEEDAGIAGRRGGLADLFDKYKIYLIAGAVVAGLGGWQWYQKHHRDVPETTPPPPSPMIVPQADPLSPEKPLPALQGAQKPAPARPSIAAPDNAPKPQAAPTPVVSPSPKPEPSSASVPSPEEKMRSEQIDALQERIADLEDEIDSLKRKLRGVSALSGRVDILERKLARATFRNTPKKPAAGVSKKAVSKKSAKKHKTTHVKRAGSFALLGTYMNEQGQWVAQVLIGDTVYEMRAGEKHRGIRVQRVDDKGAVINGRHY